MGEDYCPGILRILLWTLATALCQITKEMAEGREGNHLSLELFNSLRILHFNA